MLFWVDRFVIWLVVWGLLTLRALPEGNDQFGLARHFYVWVIPASQTLTLLALYRYACARSRPLEVGGVLLSGWVGRWVAALAVSTAICLLLQAVLPREWTGLAAIPFVAGSIGATAYLLYRILMDVGGVLEARDTSQSAP